MCVLKMFIDHKNNWGYELCIIKLLIEIFIVRIIIVRAMCYVPVYTIYIYDVSFKI